jgi:hypothetical protein
MVVVVVVGARGVRAALGGERRRLLVEIERARLVVRVATAATAFGVAALQKYFDVVRELGVLEEALRVVEGLWAGAACEALVGGSWRRPVLAACCFED